MILSFTVNQAMYLALARGEAAPLARALRALPRDPRGRQWANFVRNHDELTLDKLSEDERAEVFAAFGPEKRPPAVRPRAAPAAAERWSAATSGGSAWPTRLTFSLPGHAGAVLRRGDRDGGEPRHRGPPERPDADGVVRGAHGGFTTADEPVRPVVEGGFGPDRVNVARQRRDDELAAELDGAADPPPPRVPGARLGRDDRPRQRRHARCSPTARTGRRARSSPCHSFARGAPHGADREQARARGPVRPRRAQAVARARRGAAGALRRALVPRAATRRAAAALVDERHVLGERHVCRRVPSPVSSHEW